MTPQTAHEILDLIENLRSNTYTLFGIVADKLIMANRIATLQQNYIESLEYRIEALEDKLIEKSAGHY